MDLSKAIALTDVNAQENQIMRATFPELRPGQYTITSAVAMTVPNDRPGEVENGYKRPERVGFIRCTMADGSTKNLTGWHFTRSSSKLGLDGADNLIALAGQLTGKSFYVYNTTELVGKKERPIWSYQPQA